MSFNEFDQDAMDPNEIVTIAEAIVYDKYIKISEPLWKKVGWLVVEFLEPAGRIATGITYLNSEEY